MDKQIDSQMAPLIRLKEEIMVQQRLPVCICVQIYTMDGRSNGIWECSKWYKGRWSWLKKEVMVELKISLIFNGLIP